MSAAFHFVSANRPPCSNPLPPKTRDAVHFVYPSRDSPVAAKLVLAASKTASKMALLWGKTPLVNPQTNLRDRLARKHWQYTPANQTSTASAPASALTSPALPPSPSLPAKR